MDVLLISFIAAALGQWGDKTQWLAAALAARYRRPGPILVGLGVAAIANAVIAGFAGRIVHGTITPHALVLLLALAFAFAAVEGLIGRRPRPMGEGWRTGPLVTAAACVFLLGLGDKGQFVTFALSARYDAPFLAAAGGAAGMIAGASPAVFLGDRFERSLPVRAIRIGVAIAFAIAAFILAVNALRLT